MFAGVLCLYSFYFVSILVLQEEERKRVALLLLSYICHVTVNVLWLFLALPLDGLQCVIVVFPDHTYLLFSRFSETQKSK